MGRVTGIGGVFFKSRTDPKALAAWYRDHLGVRLEDWGGVIFRWPDDKAEDRGVTVWHVAEAGSDWFKPSESAFMINYRVDDLLGLIADLKKAGIKILKGPDADENGKFAWIMDPDGNKVELWQPMKADENKGR